MRIPTITCMFLLFAGCIDDGPIPEPASEPSACAFVAYQDDCIDAFAAGLELSGCVETRFVLDLTRVVYSLPAGYRDSPSETSPQRLALSYATCDTLAWRNISQSAVSFGQLAVIVETDNPAPDADVDLYALETLTDSSALRAFLQAGGFSVENVTVKITQAIATRDTSATGDVSYRLHSTFIPMGDSDPVTSPILTFMEAHRNATAWYGEEHACTQYFYTAIVQVEATKGRLAEAIPYIQPTQGHGSQAIRCDTTLQLMRYT